jgi:hypothetical protein
VVARDRAGEAPDMLRSGPASLLAIAVLALAAAVTPPRASAVGFRVAGGAIAASPQRAGEPTRVVVALRGAAGRRATVVLLLSPDRRRDRRDVVLDRVRVRVGSDGRYRVVRRPRIPATTRPGRAWLLACAPGGCRPLGRVTVATRVPVPRPEPGPAPGALPTPGPIAGVLPPGPSGAAVPGPGPTVPTPGPAPAPTGIAFSVAELELPALSWSFTEEEAEAAPRPVVVTNHGPGTESLELLAIGTERGNPFGYADFVLRTPGDGDGLRGCERFTTLAAGTSCRALLRWLPRREHTTGFDGRLVVRRPGATTSLAELPVHAEGYSRAGFAATQVDAAVEAGQPANLALTITNSGDAPGVPHLVLAPTEGDAPGGRFAVGDGRPNDCARPIAPGSSCVWPLGFDSSNVGTFTTHVLVSDRDRGGASASRVRVTVDAPPPGPPGGAP